MFMRKLQKLSNLFFFFKSKETDGFKKPNPVLTPQTNKKNGEVT